MTQRRPRIAVLIPSRDRDDGLAELLTGIGASARVVVATPSEPTEEVRRVEALVTWNGGNPRLLFERLGEIPPQLRWIHHSGVGVDQFLDNRLAASEVIITNVRGLDLYAGAMAEYVMGLILMFAKRLLELERNRQQRSWMPLVHRGLQGHTIGIVGLGAIGKAVARLALAFGMEVLGTRRHVEAEHLAGVEVLPPSLLEELLGRSEYIVLSAPRTRQTQHLIDRRALEQMRPGAVLINVARGGLIDDEALLDALKRGRLGGAALDVFSPEPLPAVSPLWSAPNLFVSPHMSSLIGPTDPGEIEAVVVNLKRFAAGHPLLRVVDKQAGY